MFYFKFWDSLYISGTDKVIYFRFGATTELPIGLSSIKGCTIECANSNNPLVAARPYRTVVLAVLLLKTANINVKNVKFKTKCKSG